MAPRLGIDATTLFLTLSGVLLASGCATHPPAPGPQPVDNVCDIVPKTRSGIAPRAPPPTVQTPGTGSLVGTVEDRVTGDALPGVVVVVLPGGPGVVTDSTGGFTLTLRPGRYVVQLGHLAYARQNDTIDVAVDSILTRKYRLQYYACPLERVVPV
jgi:hypothetical protein